MQKKILFITAFPPNQKTAGQDYSRRLILELIHNNYDVSLIYASFPEHETDLPPQVKTIHIIEPRTIKNCIGNMRFHPFYTKRFDKKTLRIIQNIAGEYDMLYFDFSQVHLYSLLTGHHCKVMMCHDVIYQKYTRKLKGIKPLWIYNTEKRILQSAKAVFTFSDKDSDLIRKIYGIESIPVHFYLKTDSFQYVAQAEISNDFCLYGAWNRQENVDSLLYFLKKIYPLLDQSKNFFFHIIGGGMDDKLKQRLGHYTNISYKGYVDDPIAEISKCQALIAPLRQGAGVKVKVVDALTSGTSVVGTDVAFEGLSDNEEYSLFYCAKTPEKYAETINEWKYRDRAYKQAAANEFYKRYDENHFTDHIHMFGFENE